MGQLQDVLLDKSKRDQVISDCVQLVDDEVAAKGGISGLSIKAVYGMVKKVKPGIIRELVDKLLEPFVGQLDPIHGRFVQSGSGTLATYMQTHSTEVANALLHITDERAARADNRVLKSAYEKLRPTGVKHVEAAVPGIARVLAKYV